MTEENKGNLVRLQKFIADSGVTSRRKAEELIVQGKVLVNGRVVMELGTKVDPDLDTVEVDGKTASLESIQKIYLVMNKPRGFVTTVSDPEGRPTVMDLCKEISERIYPVGRLDYLSEGLLILTNDGDLANKIMHPRYNITKIYEVKVFGAMTETILEKLRAGAKIDGVFMRPNSVRIIKQLAGKTWIEFKLTEGKNREIRKICEACGVTVDKLRRIAIGGLSIEGISVGDSLYMPKKKLMTLLGITDAGTPPSHRPEYRSPKKTIDLHHKGPQTAVPADDRSFMKFRREYYFATIKAMNEVKKQKAEAAGEKQKVPMPVRKPVKETSTKRRASR